jgi:TRAP transporter TAXI family solute receptor
MPAAALAALLASTAALAPAARAEVTVIASNPQGSIYYTVCAAIAKEMDANLHMAVRVQPMGGSTVYIPILNRGEVDFALTNIFDTMTAYAGTHNFKIANPNLRVVAAMFPITAAYLVPTDSPVKTIADLKGRTLPGVFKAQTIGLVLQASVLATAGLTEKDVRIIPTATQFSGVDLLADGKVDAALISVGTGQGQKANVQLSSHGGVRFVDIGNAPAAVAGLKKFMPGRPFLLQPSPARLGIRTPTYVMAYDVFLTTNAKMSDDTAYRIAKLVHDGKDRMVQTAPALVDMNPDRMTSEIGVPWHPGALRYYKEVGQWPPKG